MEILASVAVGALATTFSGLAARDSFRAKQGQRPWPRLLFWLAVSLYMASFTLLRGAAALGLPGLEGIFFLQTFGGASTVIFLLYIMVGVIFGHEWARAGSEFGAIAATVVLTLIFSQGTIGPREDVWSIEFLPSSVPARITIAAVYVMLPVAMSALSMWATRGADPELRRRSFLFSTSVVLMFVPNAIKYVTFVTGPASLALAAIMAYGTYLGWRSYHVKPDA